MDLNIFIKPVYAVQTTVEDPLNGRFRTLSDIIGWILNIILGVGWALVFVMLALGFIKFIVSRGEPKAVDAARSWLIYSVLGGVGLFFLTSIRMIITGLLGADPNIGPVSITGFWGN